jgi:hypothetical protein
MSIQEDLATSGLPQKVIEAAQTFYAKVAHNTLLVGDSTCVSGYWIETHTLGCRNAADEAEADWQASHEKIFNEYKQDSACLVFGDPWEGGVFLTISKVFELMNTCHGTPKKPGG